MSLTLTLIALHVFAAAFWLGSTLFLIGFVSRAIAANPVEGGAFMQRLMVVSRFPVALAVAGATTILSGFWMFWIVSGGFSRGFMASPTGVLISIGAACGIGATITGAITGRLRERGGRFAIATASLLVTALVLMTVGSHI